MILGIVAWIVSEENLASDLTPQVLTVIGTLGAISIGLVILGYARGKATLTLFGDGLVFGVTIVFDALRLISSGLR